MGNSMGSVADGKVGAFRGDGMVRDQDAGGAATLGPDSCRGAGMLVRVSTGVEPLLTSASPVQAASAASNMALPGINARPATCYIHIPSLSADCKATG